MINEYSKIYKRGFVLDSNGEKRQIFPVSLLEHESEFLYNFCLDNKIKKVLEVGLGFGMSSVYIGQALLENGCLGHTIIDPWQEETYQNAGLLTINEAKLNHQIKYIKEKSELILPKLVSSNEQFDLCFIDGCHTFEHAFIDSFYCDQLISEGGFIVLHDLWMPSIRKLAKYLVRNKGYSIQKINTTKNIPFRSKVYKTFVKLFQYKYLFDSSFVFTLGPENICVLRKNSKIQVDHTDYLRF